MLATVDSHHTHVETPNIYRCSDAAPNELLLLFSAT